MTLSFYIASSHRNILVSCGTFPFFSLTMTTANAKLKQKNKELELMLLKANSYVAGATQGYQHYASVFAKESGGSKSSDFSSRRSSILSEVGSSVDNDGDHAMSFLWK